MVPGFIYAYWAEPDSGKSTMIFKYLMPLAEEENENILFLYPRSAMGEQLKKNTNQKMLLL